MSEQISESDVKGRRIKPSRTPERILKREDLERLKRSLVEDLLRLATRPFAGIGHNSGPPLEAEPPVYDIPGFCRAHLISWTGLYEQWRNEVGPKFFKVGTSVRITREAAAQWRRERESATDQGKGVDAIDLKPA